MNDGRMTAAEARAAARGTGPTDFALKAVLESAADALAQYEAEEATRRARDQKMLGAISWLMGCAGKFTGPNDGVHPYWWRSEFCRRAPIRYDGGRYVLVEPEPVVTREQGPSGWWYEVEGNGVRMYEASEPCNCYTFSSHPRIPPADRPLVARLLGEVG